MSVVLAHGTGSTAVVMHVGLAGLAVAAAVGGAVLLRRHGRNRWQSAAWIAALAALAVALAPPLDEAAGRWLTAHMAQHVVLLLVVAPLVAASGVVPRLPAALTAPAAALLVAAVHVVVLVAWHVPGLHELALARDPVHVAEHATLLLVGTGYWLVCAAAVRSRQRADLAAALAATAVLIASGLALGLLMAFATDPWYASYAGSAALAPLADQQAAGMLMWGAGGPVYLAATAWLVGVVLATGDQAAPRSDAALEPSG